MHAGSEVALRSLFFHMRRILVLVVIGGVLILVAGAASPAAAQLGSGDLTSTGEMGLTDGSSPGKVDLNRASAEEIVKLAGVSADVAERIVRHRPYKKLDDLVTRKILGKKEFARIREQVVVGRTDR